MPHAFMTLHSRAAEPAYRLGRFKAGHRAAVAPGRTGRPAGDAPHNTVQPYRTDVPVRSGGLLALPAVRMPEVALEDERDQEALTA